MAAGKYRHRVTIEQPTRTENRDGQIVHAWATYATIWAAVTISGGNQSTPHRQQQAEVSAVITCRASSTTRGITAGMRVRWGDYTFHVAAADDVQALHREVQITGTSQRVA